MFFITVLLCLGSYYILRINKFLDYCISHINNKNSYIVFLCISFLLIILTLPFYLYVNNKLKQINDINKEFLKKKNNSNFDMYEFKKSMDIPSSNFIYIGIIPIILLVGLGLKISNYFTLNFPTLIIILLYIFTFICTFYYSYNFLKNILSNIIFTELISFGVCLIVLYLTSIEEQLFLIFFSGLTYLCTYSTLLKNRHKS